VEIQAVCKQLSRTLPVLIAVLASAPAAGSDLFGAGSRNIALGGAVSATCDDGNAAWYNPALLGAIPTPRLALGYTGMFPSVDATVEDFGSLGQVAAYRVEGSGSGSGGPAATLTGQALQDAFDQAADLDAYSAIGVHFVLPLQSLFPGFPVPAGFGGSFIIPQAGTALAAYSSRTPTQPFFPSWNTPFGQARIQFGLGVEAWKDVLWLGAGTSVHSTAAGEVVTLTPIATFDPAKPEQNQPTPSNASTSQGLDLSISPVAGLLVKPVKWLKVGLAYRGEEETRIAMDVRASMVLNLGEPVQIDLPYVMSGSFAYKPHRFAAALALEPADELTLSLEGTLGLWSTFSPHVQVLSFKVADSALDEYGAVFIDDLGTRFRATSEPLPVVSVRDTLIPAAGVEYRFRFGLDLRGGYAYRPSPLNPDQGHVNMLMDNSWHQVSLGAGLRLSGDAQGPRTVVNLHGQGVLLVSRYNRVGAPDADGASMAGGLVESSGWMGGFGVELVREF